MAIKQANKREKRRRYCRRWPWIHNRRRHSRLVLRLIWPGNLHIVSRSANLGSRVSRSGRFRRLSKHRLWSWGAPFLIFRPSGPYSFGSNSCSEQIGANLILAVRVQGVAQKSTGNHTTDPEGEDERQSGRTNHGWRSNKKFKSRESNRSNARIQYIRISTNHHRSHK